MEFKPIDLGPIENYDRMFICPLELYEVTLEACRDLPIEVVYSEYAPRGRVLAVHPQEMIHWTITTPSISAEFFKENTKIIMTSVLKRTTGKFTDITEV